MSQIVWHPTKASLQWVEENLGKHFCQICGNPVNIFPVYYHQMRKIPKFCSSKCRGIASRKISDITCAICGEVFHAPPSQAKARVTCGRECYRKLQRQRYSQHGNPNWRGGIQYIRMVIRNSPLYDQFRSDVLHRDGFQCQDCGAQAAKRRRTHQLDVHHIVEVEKLLSKIFDPTNGISLCPPCHSARGAKPSSDEGS